MGKPPQPWRRAGDCIRAFIFQTLPARQTRTYILRLGAGSSGLVVAQTPLLNGDTSPPHKPPHPCNSSNASGQSKCSPGEARVLTLKVRVSWIPVEGPGRKRPFSVYFGVSRYDAGEELTWNNEGADTIGLRVSNAPPQHTGHKACARTSSTSRYPSKTLLCVRKLQKINK